MEKTYYQTRPYIGEKYGFYEGIGGSIEIQYHDLNGNPITYTNLRLVNRLINRKTIAPAALEAAEAHRTPFRRVRHTPSQSIELGRKYSSPAKDEIGEQIQSPLYIPLALPKDIDTLFITEGEIKAHIATLHGIPTVAFAGIYQAVNSEANPDCFTYGGEPYETIKPELLEIPFKSLCVVFDSDAASKPTAFKRRAFLKAAIKIVRAWYALNDPRPIHFAVINPNQPHKGLDDITLAAPKVAKLILSKESSQAAMFAKLKPVQYTEQLHEIIYNNGFNMTQDEATRFRLSDGELSIVRLGRGQRFVADAVTAKQSENSIVIAQTGTGKTSFVYKNLVNQGIRCIVAVPMQSQVLGFAAKAQDRAVNPKNIEPQVHYEKSKVDLGDVPPRLIVTTYDSLPNLTAHLQGKYGTFECLNYRLVLDEAHNFVTSSSKHYKLKQYAQAVDSAVHYGAVTALSGTYIPVPVPLFERLQLIEFNSPKRPVPLQIVQAKHVSRYAALRINEAIKNGFKVVCLLNNKKLRGQTLYSMVSTANKAMLNADTKDTIEYANLVHRSTLGQLDYIQATKLIQEGLDIFDTDKTLYVVLGSEHPADIWQLVNRHRAAKVACLWITGKKYGQARKASYNRSKQAEEQYAEAEATKYTGDSGELDELFKFVGTKNYFSPSHIRYHGLRVWGVERLAMANTAYNEQRSLAHSSYDALFDNCKFWGFEPQEGERYSELAEDKSEEAEVLAEAARLQRDLEIEEVKAEVRNDNLPRIYLMTYDFAKEAVRVLELPHVSDKVKKEAILACDSSAALSLWCKRKSVADRLRHRTKTADTDFERMAMLRRYLLDAKRATWTGNDLMEYYNKYAPRRVHTVGKALEKIRLLVNLERAGAKKQATYKVSKLIDFSVSFCK